MKGDSRQKSGVGIKIKRISNGDLIFYCPGCGCLQRLTSAWSFDGDFKKPTIHPSIKTQGVNEEERLEYICHSFIAGGKIQFLDDCTHKLKNQIVELPDIDDYFTEEE